MVTFCRLRQQAQLLSWATRTNFSGGFSKHQSTYLSAFSRHHTATTNLIILNSISFGSTILAFVVGFSLVNSYFSYQLLFSGSIKGAITVAILGNLLAMQWILIGAIHLLAAQFASRIHAPKKALFSWSAAKLEHQNGRKIWEQLWDVHFLLKLDAYATRLNTNNRYGISYGGRGLGLVSAQSFQKVSKMFPFF